MARIRGARPPTPQPASLRRTRRHLAEAQSPPKKIASTGLVTFSDSHRAELNMIWQSDRRMPTIESRRVWAEARNIEPTLVHAWFSRKKYNAINRHGEAISDEVYELSVYAPASSPREQIKIKSERAASPPSDSSLQDKKWKARTEVNIELGVNSGKQSLDAKPHMVRHTRAHDNAPHPACLTCNPLVLDNSDTEISLAQERSLSPVPSLTDGLPSSDFDDGGLLTPSCSDDEDTNQENGAQVDAGCKITSSGELTLFAISSGALGDLSLLDHTLEDARIDVHPAPALTDRKLSAYIQHASQPQVQERRRVTFSLPKQRVSDDYQTISANSVSDSGALSSYSGDPSSTNLAPEAVEDAGYYPFPQSLAVPPRQKRKQAGFARGLVGNCDPLDILAKGDNSTTSVISSVISTSSYAPDSLNTEIPRFSDPGIALPAGEDGSLPTITSEHGMSLTSPTADNAYRSMERLILPLTPSKDIHDRNFSLSFQDHQVSPADIPPPVRPPGSIPSRPGSPEPPRPIRPEHITCTIKAFEKKSDDQGSEDESSDDEPLFNIFAHRVSGKKKSRLQQPYLNSPSSRITPRYRYLPISYRVYQPTYWKWSSRKLMDFLLDDPLSQQRPFCKRDIMRTASIEERLRRPVQVLGNLREVRSVGVATSPPPPTPGFIEDSRGPCGTDRTVNTEIFGSPAKCEGTDNAVNITSASASTMSKPEKAENKNTKPKTTKKTVTKRKDKLGTKLAKSSSQQNKSTPGSPVKKPRKRVRPKKEHASKKTLEKPSSIYPTLRSSSGEFCDQLLQQYEDLPPLEVPKIYNEASTSAGQTSAFSFAQPLQPFSYDTTELSYSNGIQWDNNGFARMELSAIPWMTTVGTGQVSHSTYSSQVDGLYGYMAPGIPIYQGTPWNTALHLNTSVPLPPWPQSNTPQF